MSKTEKHCVTQSNLFGEKSIKFAINQKRWKKFAKGSLQIIEPRFQSNTMSGSSFLFSFEPLQSQTVTMKIIPKFNILNQDTIPDKIFGDPENWDILAHKITI